MVSNHPIQSHDYVGPVLVACCVEVPLPGTKDTLQSLLLGVGPDLHALTDVAGSDGSCVARSARRRFLLPHSTHLHGLVCAPPSGPRLVAAFGPYGLALCELDVATGRDLRLEVCSATRLPDWPLDVAWIEENSALLVAYGRNFLERWRLGPDSKCLAQEARWAGPSEVSFLYSASLCVSTTSSLCAAGTFDGFVVLWRISQASAEAQLMGHQGAIFHIRFYGTCIVTASDDRTVRLWVTDDASGWRCSAVCKGHGCRVWDALLAPNDDEVAGCIVTASEDSLVRIFSMQGALLRELQGHQTRGVRCLEVLHDFTWGSGSASGAPVVSGGEDGGVKLWPLQLESPQMKRDWQVPEVNDWIREVLLLSHDQALLATNFGKIYRLHFAEGDVACELLYHQAGACFTAMARGGRAIWIGLADGRGLILNEGGGASVMVEVFRQCRVSAAFGGDAGNGLFCDHAGRVHFFNVRDGEATLLAEKQIASKKGDKNQRLLCGLLLSNPADPLWLLGDEHGRLHLLNLQESQQHLGAHEGKVLSLLQLESLEFLSAGADGVVMRHRLDPGETSELIWTQLATYRPGCGLKHLSHVQLQAAASGDVMPPLFLGAFQSADFVLWDSAAGLEVWRHRCGGAKRPNSLLVDNAQSFTFAFSASKSLEIHSTASSDQSFPPKALLQPLHGREVHQICWLRAPSFDGTGILATASEDTSLRLLQVSGATKDQLSLAPAAATVRFPGAVRALCSLPESPGTWPLLVSGGAKGQLKAHLLDGNSLLCVWSTTLGEVDPVKIEDEEPDSSDASDHGEEPPPNGKGDAARLEERVMALSCVQLENSEVLLAAASSSGFLRTWQLQLDGKALRARFLARWQVFGTTALCMECFTGPTYQAVFVGSAAGQLAAVKIGGSLELLAEIQLHQAGVNDLAIRRDGTVDRVAVLTAGDDHALGLCHYAVEDDALHLVGSRLIEAAHFSALRSVAWSNGEALSLGLDRRLRRWRTGGSMEAELELESERISSCTEPETMAASHPPGDCLVALAGRGVELCSL